MVERTTRFVGLAAVLVALGASGCAEPEDDWPDEAVQSQGIGRSAGRKDLELAPGDDLVPIEVPWSNVKDYEKVAGISVRR